MSGSRHRGFLSFGWIRSPKAVLDLVREYPRSHDQRLDHPPEAGRSNEMKPQTTGHPVRGLPHGIRMMIGAGRVHVRDIVAHVCKFCVGRGTRDHPTRMVHK